MHELLEIVARRLQERRQLADDLVVARLRPLDRRVVHLVDHNHKLAHTESLRKHSVLASLAAALKARLELALASADDENAGVRLRRTLDHVGHVVLVAWRVQHRETLLGRLEVGTADLDGLALRSLLLVGVHDEGEEPALAVALLRLALELLDGSAVDHTRQVQDVARQRRLSGVNVADEHNVEVVARVVLVDHLSSLRRLNCLLRLTVVPASAAGGALSGLLLGPSTVNAPIRATSSVVAIVRLAAVVGRRRVGGALVALALGVRGRVG
mmetsp:Transcript_15384/g.53432  ORF Transcript_15384/g.53432 Transcript_15384/m.53432 type:complete len:270 (-) Transcript_15384:231-1040(-)